MSGDRLSSLQWRVLRILAGLQPPYTLTAGAALAGVHLGHRVTRDLDLFWRGLRDLGSIPRQVESALVAEGLSAEPVQTSPPFCRLRVSEGKETCFVDLVAEPVPALEAPAQLRVQGVSIAVDTAHEILVNKLCALLSRSELRDLVDVRALLDSGEDLRRALADAPRKDSGFSPLTLAWVLKGLDPRVMAGALGWAAAEAEKLERFRLELIEKILSVATPE